MKKIIITGSSGLIGSYIKKDLSNDYNVIGIDIALSPTTDKIIDIRNKIRLSEIINAERPDIIINTAAIKDLVLCQNKIKKSWEINTASAGYLSDLSSKVNSFFIQISSDIVFDGIDGDYSEDDEPAPINWYGATKYAAELLISKNINNKAILRTAQVISPISKEDSKTLRRCLKSGVLTNQSLYPYYVAGRLLFKMPINASLNISSTTPVSLLSYYIKKIISSGECGIYHAAGLYPVSRYNLAIELAKEFELNTELIRRDSTKDYLRPMDVSLNIGKILKLTGVSDKEYDTYFCIKKWVYEYINQKSNQTNLK